MVHMYGASQKVAPVSSTLLSNPNLLLTRRPQTMEKYFVKPSEQPFKYSLRLRPILPSPSSLPIEKMAAGRVTVTSKA